VIGLHGWMQVKGLAFNQLSPNLLASGGADGDIIIWDVANPRKPTAFPPLKVCQKAIYSSFRTLVGLFIA
jgi:WD40 repeat protein